MPERDRVHVFNRNVPVGAAVVTFPLTRRGDPEPAAVQCPATLHDGLAVVQLGPMDAVVWVGCVCVQEAE